MPIELVRVIRVVNGDGGLRDELAYLFGNLRAATSCVCAISVTGVCGSIRSGRT
ncbi:hypothetical protein [Mycobacterium pseudokansasii]|uniref:Uncharacterized protein n=1 Tax=Mycobacterium pseudokansasii TaxID=2341080 RepID=A0A498QHE9_9MYCO|nr:hypothetical protein [Mycobacterium pseudokansasii]MBY0389971.1 hypothetical protein [Mycobacterium pseudokansasii]VAZ88603.1 hypothetical protein LAUMK35_00602 [Mycobacterium pseudokansasii]VAZ89077.1 hypothetical protein LAUMK21_00603 [Mycobacterium pseudokansasii]VBA46785.1 hypothetical protein LAUMK142_00478 [Mycobacterium pseudokansasii]